MNHFTTPQPPSSREETTLSPARLARFSAVAVPVAAAGLPIGVYLPAIFARDFGLSLGVIGAIFLAGRLWDGLLDPVVGALSDHTRTRYGRRKPWILGGGILFALASILLFFPPDDVSALYLTLVLFFFYLGWTGVQIPFLAWSGEISGQYHERTRIATYQTVIAAAALVLTLLLPTIAAQIRPDDGKLQLALMGSLVLVTIPISLFLTLGALPEESPAECARQPFSIGRSLRAVFGNPLLLRVLASDFAVTLGQSIRGALFVFFVSFYMGRPDWAAALFLFQFVFGIIAGPIWLRIGRRFGKHRTAVLGEVAQTLINLSLLLVTPERFDLLLVLTLAQGLAQGSGNLMLRAIVADVADKQRLDSGEESTGLYYSVFTLAGKLAAAVAIGIALPLIAWFGFDPQAHNSAQALNGLLYVFALGPALSHALSALLVFGFPLDESAHSEIRRQLEIGPAALAPAE